MGEHFVGYVLIKRGEEVFLAVYLPEQVMQATRQLPVSLVGPYHFLQVSRVRYKPHVIGISPAVNLLPQVGNVACRDAIAGPPACFCRFLPRPQHAIDVALNVLPRLFALTPELVNVPGYRKVVNEIYGGAGMIERDNLYPVCVAYLHELCVLLTPAIAKQPIHLGDDNYFHLPIGYFPVHIVEGGAILHPQLTGQAQVPIVHEDKLVGPTADKRELLIYLHLG